MLVHVTIWKSISREASLQVDCPSRAGILKSTCKHLRRSTAQFNVQAPSASLSLHSEPAISPALFPQRRLHPWPF